MEFFEKIISVFTNDLINAMARVFYRCGGFFIGFFIFNTNGINWIRFICFHNYAGLQTIIHCFKNPVSLLKRENYIFQEEPRAQGFKGSRARAKYPSGKELLADTEETTTGSPIKAKVVKVELAIVGTDTKIRILTTATGIAPNGAKNDNRELFLEFWVSSGQS